MVTSEDMEKFVSDYSNFYYAKNKFDQEGKVKNDYVVKKQNFLGKYVKIGTSDSAVEAIAENSVFPKTTFDTPCQEITWKHIAWKAGRLKYDEKEDFPEEYKKTIQYSDNGYTWDGCNGYGNPIEHIEEYLKAINEKCYSISKELLEQKDNNEVFDQIKNAYEALLKLNEEQNVKYFGSVYILTLIFFLSKGKFPIYDKFAYKAAKALFYNANPKDVTVETSLDKKDTDKVLTLYCEYCWLLTQLFQTYSITREQDQALWVYGHSKEKYSVSDDKSMEKKLFDFDRVIE